MVTLAASSETCYALGSRLQFFVDIYRRTLGFGKFPRRLSYSSARWTAIQTVGRVLEIHSFFNFDRLGGRLRYALDGRLI